MRSCLLLAAVVAAMVSMAFGDDTHWIDIETLGVNGRAFPVSDLPAPYTRLPKTASNLGPVWDLSQTSTGDAKAPQYLLIADRNERSVHHQSHFVRC